MDTVRRGFKALHELEDYVDAQAGGPGKGFFQIVTDPYEARRVVNQGRMAVIQEIEISELFDCANIDDADVRPGAGRHPARRDAQARRPLVAAAEQVRQPAHRRALRRRRSPASSSTRATRPAPAQYWSAETCKGPLADNTIETLHAAGQHRVQPAARRPSASRRGRRPTYPPAPHCNTRGLTTLGKHVVNRMMDLHMIVNPDHMSQAGVDETLTLLEARDYSGVISPHGWMDPGNWPRLWKLGGMAFPGHSSATSYVDEWKKFRPKSTPYKFGWGYGADLGGLSHQPEVEGDGAIAYPFKSYDGSVTFERQKTGDRTFDYTKEGVAHYGLYPDWFEDLRRLGGQAMADDMLAGAESYLEMWERADGVPDTACHPRGGPISTARPRRPAHRRRLGDAAQGRRPAPAAHARVELVREGPEERRQGRRRRARPRAAASSWSARPRAASPGRSGSATARRSRASSAAGATSRSPAGAASAPPASPRRRSSARPSSATSAASPPPARPS